MGRIDRALHRLRPVALLQLLRDVAVALGDVRPLELRQLRQGQVGRTHVGPDVAAPRASGVGRHPDLFPELRLRRFRGHVQAVAVHVELPAVVDAAQAALLVATPVELRLPVGAAPLDQPDGAGRVAKGDELLAEHAYAHGWAVRLGQLRRDQHRRPEAPEEVAHGRPRAGAGQQLVVVGAQHFFWACPVSPCPYITGCSLTGVATHSWRQTPLYSCG